MQVTAPKKHGVDSGDWENLTEEQKRGIFDAIEEIELGKGIPNEWLGKKL